MKHTPLPWKTKYVQVADKWEILGANKNGTEKWIGVMIWGSEPEDIANNEFIIRACNSHYELLEACKRTVEMFDKNSTAMNELPYTYTRLKQVIAKAEGKE